MLAAAWALLKPNNQSSFVAIREIYRFFGYPSCKELECLLLQQSLPVATFKVSKIFKKGTD